MLPEPKHSMLGNPVPVKAAFGKIVEAFENEVWVGQLRERWKEIKCLHS